VYENSEGIEREWMRERMAPKPSRRTAKGVLAAETDLARRLARDDGAETAAVQEARVAVARARVT
jgi:hypothetical protein